MLIGELLVVGKHFFCTEKQHILTIPERNLLIMPYASTQGIDGDKAMLLEQFGPVLRPLLVEMMSTSLIGNGRR
jgi:hypothetical protein